jgi:predicted flavoprotein YhiN
MSLDNTLNRYDPHMIAETKMTALKNYKEAKRMFKKLTRMLDKKIASRFLHYRFLTNEKHAVKDAEAKAKIDTEVQEIEIKLDEAEELMDDMFCELDRITTKIELMADANATHRAEIRLGGLTP